jgi:hypothetical protein
MVLSAIIKETCHSFYGQLSPKESFQGAVLIIPFITKSVQSTNARNTKTCFLLSQTLPTHSTSAGKEKIEDIAIERHRQRK